MDGLCSWHRRGFAVGDEYSVVSIWLGQLLAVQLCMDRFRLPKATLEHARHATGFYGYVSARDLPMDLDGITAVGIPPNLNPSSEWLGFFYG